MSSEKVDVLVIGAGPSGAVAASIIHKHGLKVKVVEKLKFPRFVIGESLLPRCMEALEEAELLEAVKAKGFQQKFGAKFVKDGKICDFNFSNQFTQGWSWTWQVPRADFDKTLTDEMQRKGIPVLFETGVTDIKFNGSDSITTIEDKDGNKSTIEARFIVDASGYGRVIPKLFNLDQPSNLPARRTLFAHTVDVNRFVDEEPNRITIVSHEPGVWIWIIPFSNGNTSVGFVGDTQFFDRFQGTPEERFRAMIKTQPHTQRRFDAVDLVFEPRTLEGWSVTTNKFYGDGFVLTGNVTEFLDPIFSSGVTLATVSGATASNLVVKKLKGQNVDWEKEFMEPTMQGVNTFRSYVMGWYDGTLQDIFFAPKPDEEIKKQICSVLAGYVWDLNNPFVKKHDRVIKNLSHLIRLEEGAS